MIHWPATPEWTQLGHLSPSPCPVRVRSTRRIRTKRKE
jgi:hypothetical protein